MPASIRPEQVLAELDKRESDTNACIRPQKQWADMVVRFHAPSEPPDQERLGVRLTLRPSLSHPDLSRVVESSRSALTLAIERENGRLAELLEIDGLVRPEQTSAIKQAIWAQQPELKTMLEDGAGAFAYGKEERRSRPLAITQLLIAYHLLVKRLAKEQLLEQMKRQGAMASS